MIDAILNFGTQGADDAVPGDGLIAADNIIHGQANPQTLDKGSFR